jgi:ABC-type lipoprotein release transport system permease subunit
VTVRLPEGEYGRPALTLDEPWVRKGAALTILRGTDEKSVVLLALVLVVCALFVANAALAAVRTRRAEIGVLRALGWTPRSVFIATLGEVAVLGLAAGVLGSGLAAGLVTALELDFPLVRTLAIPVVAVGLAVAAGTLPAGLAARAQPLDALRGSRAEPRTAHEDRQPHGPRQPASSTRPRRPRWSWARDRGRLHDGAPCGQRRVRGAVG